MLATEIEKLKQEKAELKCVCDYALTAINNRKLVANWEPLIKRLYEVIGDKQGYLRHLELEKLR